MLPCHAAATDADYMPRRRAADTRRYAAGYYADADYAIAAARCYFRRYMPFSL